MQAADRGHPDVLAFLTELREKSSEHCGPNPFPDLQDFLRELAEEAGAEQPLIVQADRGGYAFVSNDYWLREQTEEAAGTEQRRNARADRGGYAFVSLDWLRKHPEEAGGEAQCWRSVDRGDPYALVMLSVLREQAGDAPGGERLRRYGLTGAGKIADRLDFDP